MTPREDTTQKWVTKFCGLMDWFIGLEKVHGDNLGDASAKGLAANYLAVKLGIFDESTPADAPYSLDKEPPYTSHLWQPDHFEDSSFQERKKWRLERMTHWRRKAEERGVFKSTPFTPEVTPDNVRRYCDCIESIIYRANDWCMFNMPGELWALGRQANDLAAKLGLTHPDWILAMDLHLLPYFVDAEEIRQLPLPWDYDKPPIMPRKKFEVVTASDLPRLRASIEKAQSLLRREAIGELKGMSVSEEIPSEHRSAPLSLKRMAELWRGEMTVKKLRAMINNRRIRVMAINRQTFVFDTRDLPSYAVEEARR